MQDERDTRIKELEEALTQRDVLIAELSARLKELESRLNRDSDNSHQPSSTDKPWKKRYPKKAKSARKPGGQPGHPGHARTPLPPEQVDEVVDVRPATCGHCGEALATPTVVGEPWRHQVTERAGLRMTITEYRLWHGGCKACGRTTRAAWPTGMPRSNFGPKLEALVAMLIGRYRLSRREVRHLLRDMSGLVISVGAVAAICRRVSQALAVPFAEVEAEVQASVQQHLDETGFRERGQRRWLWVAVAPGATLFRILHHRSQAARIELAGAHRPGSVVISDRYSGYNDLPVEDRAVCHAHLLRDFKALVARGGDAAQWGQKALAEQRRLFDLHHGQRRGEIDAAEARRRLRPIKARLGKLFWAGMFSPDKRLRGFCTELQRLWSALFTFVERPEIDGTNNAAERALRPAVIWRKTCMGTASQAGNVFAERMLTVIATCQQRGRHLLDYLTAVCQAVAAGSLPPSLLAPVA